MIASIGSTNHFPGGTSVSRLSVYPWAAPDGLAGGTPHFHTTCSEAYVVLSGEGYVQTLSAEGFTETPLSEGVVVWFGPGIIHRLVNDHDLRLLVVMQNSGLPEAGDAVMTFPVDSLVDAERYRSAATLDEHPEDSARARQSLAVQGFTALRRAVELEGPDALVPLYRAGAALVAPRLEQWRGIWRDGAAAAAAQTASMLDALEAGDPAHLSAARLDSRPHPAHAYGMCGYLDTYLLA
ncbi:cupin domain-containing protein [Leifsonia poae]|uniref:cupin domain-containing protein n=1 Tax=Leifsonia poae TaxID=110933 RepID=UPI003D66EAFF